MIRRTALLLLLACTVLARPALAGENIRLGTEPGFAPYSFVSDSGALAGFDIDLGNELCARAGLACAWVISDWETLLPGLVAGRYDAVLAGLANTATRREIVAFSDGYEDADTVAVYVGMAAFLDPAEQLIAVQQDTIHAQYLAAQGLRSLTFPTAGAAYRAMLDGRAGLVFGAGPFLEQKVFMTSRAAQIVARVNLDSGPASVAFRKSDTALRTRFNAALRTMWDDGSLENLRQKWFGTKTGL